MEFIAQQGRGSNKFDWEDVETFTNGFSDQNFIDYMQFGKVYKGVSQGKVVAVKLLAFVGGPYLFRYEEMIEMVKQELAFLKLQTDTCFPKAIGYSLDSCNGRIAVVYDIKPRDTLHNLIKKDALDWCESMKVARKLAYALAIMHSQKCYVRNIDPAHILIDQENKPLLIEFSSMKDAIHGVKNCFHHFLGSIGYRDSEAFPSEYIDREDVFSFGAVLISLISKKIWDRDIHMKNRHCKIRHPYPFQWAISEQRETLVDESLKKHPGFDDNDGVIVTKLALRCFNPDGDELFSDCPTMAEVVDILESLSIF